MHNSARFVTYRNIDGNEKENEMLEVSGMIKKGMTGLVLLNLFFSSYRDELLGILTAVDKLSCHEGDGEFPAFLANQIFQRVDTNSDGKLSLQEFVDGAKVDIDLAAVLDRL